jgi:FHS family L-fucose permease-like MFS transporter
MKGVLAQFLYVGGQVGVGSLVIRFVQHDPPGWTARKAWFYLLGHWMGFMVGRFGGSALMKSVPAPRLLSIFVAGGETCNKFPRSALQLIHAQW